MYQSSQAKDIQKPKKNYTSCLQEGLKSHTASITSIASGTTSSHHFIKERLKSQPCSNQRQGSGSHPTTFNSFTNAFDIHDITPLYTEASAIGHLLWRRYCRCLGIKDSIFAAHNLYKYTWRIVVYMVLTGEGRLGPDIWSETLQQAKTTENMMRIMWNAEVMWRQKGSEKLDYPLAPIGKKAKHMRILLFCD